MNVLFVGPYRQNDGWGLAARDYIRALATKSDISLTTRPIYLAPGNIDQSFNDEQILVFENNISDKYDAVIQKVLPEYLFYDSRFGKNIGLFTLEICDFSNTQAIRNMNRMDEIWVPSEIEKQSLLKSGLIKPIRVISEPIETKYLSIEDRLQYGPSIDETFKFYTVCENNFRKNLEDLITAFNLAFNHYDKVSLVIKTNGNPAQLIEWANSIKKRLHINKRYRNEIFIPNQFSSEDMVKFHNSCDCFVSCSYGESFCRPAAEALCRGKNPIINKNTGMKDFIDDNNGYLVKSYKIPVVLEHNPIANNTDYYNADQYWYKIDIYDLIDKMQKAYHTYKKNKEDWIKKSELGKSQINIFSYENIGKKLCI
jgi:glycosyltransferase involved in cell wall biosynthesis